MASGPIISWQIDGETVETVSDFIFLGSKITADCDCSHEIKRCLLLGKKVMTNLDSILKSRDITLPTKVYLVKATVFPVVIYGYESWTIKKAERQKIDAFELWCSLHFHFSLSCLGEGNGNPLQCSCLENPRDGRAWWAAVYGAAQSRTWLKWLSSSSSNWRRLLRVPWTARRSNQSILKDMSPGCSLEGLMLKLKLQYFGHLMRRAESLEKSLMMGKMEGKEKGTTEDEMVGWHHRLNGLEFG